MKVRSIPDGCIDGSFGKRTPSRGPYHSVCTSVDQQQKRRPPLEQILCLSHHNAGNVLLHMTTYGYAVDRASHISSSPCDNGIHPRIANLPDPYTFPYYNHKTPSTHCDNHIQCPRHTSRQSEQLISKPNVQPWPNNPPALPL